MHEFILIGKSATGVSGEHRQGIRRECSDWSFCSMLCLKKFNLGNLKSCRRLYSKVLSKVFVGNLRLKCSLSSIDHCAMMHCFKIQMSAQDPDIASDDEIKFHKSFTLIAELRDLVLLVLGPASSYLCHLQDLLKVKQH